MSNTAFVGLGSNLNEPREQLVRAIDCMHQHPKISVRVCSHFYSSLPMGPQDQSEFINAVCKLSTSLSPLELLDALQDIELNQGRERKGLKWGPRTLDLDILLYNNLSMSNERLILPHYGMQDREFVLVPLFEIEPELMMLDGRKIASWVADCKLNGLKRLPTDFEYLSTE